MQEKKIAAANPLTKALLSETAKKSQSGSSFKQKDLKIKIQEFKNQSNKGIIRGDWTYVTLKDLNSYAIETDGQGLKVVEDSVEIYSKSFPGNKNIRNSINYREDLNCYLLNFNYQIYRKEIDDRHPYFFMDLYCVLKPGISRSHSELNTRFILAKKRSYISVVNPYQKRVEMQIRKVQLTNITSLFDIVWGQRK